MSQFNVMRGEYESDLFDYIKIDKTTNTLQTIEYPHHEIHSGNHYYLEGYITLGVGGNLFVKLVTPNTAKWGHFVWELHSSGILTTTLEEDATGGMAGGLRPTIHANNRNIDCWTGFHTGGAHATILTDATKAWTIDALIGYQVFNTKDGSSGIIVSNTPTTATVIALVGGTANQWALNDNYEINKSGFVITSGVTVNTGHTQILSNTSFGTKSAGGISSRIEEIILKQNTVYLRSFASGTAANIVGFKASWYEHTDKH